MNDTSIAEIDTSLIYYWSKATVSPREDETQFRLNLKLLHLTNENIYNGSLNWHRGVPPPPPREGGGKDEEQQTPRIPTDWDFSHLDNILETTLQKNPDHDVYLYGSVESAYDSSRPWADVAEVVRNGEFQILLHDQNGEDGDDI